MQKIVDLNKDFFRALISYSYPFSEAEILTLSGKMNWNHLVYNGNIKWTTQVLLEFENVLRTGKVPGLPDGWYHPGGFPFNKQSIEIFKDYINWELLFETLNLENKVGLIHEFFDRFEPFLKIERMEGDNNAEQEILKEMMEEDLRRNYGDFVIPDGMFDGTIHIQTIDKHFVVASDDVSVDPHKAIKFAMDHEDVIDWERLCQNFMFQWSEKMIYLFKDRLVWGCWVSDEVEHEFSLVSGLLTNRKVIITENILNDFGEKLDWKLVSGMSRIDWSKDLFVKFAGKWDYGNLMSNQSFEEWIKPEMESIKKIIFD